MYLNRAASFPGSLPILLFVVYYVETNPRIFEQQRCRCACAYVYMCLYVCFLSTAVNMLVSGKRTKRNV